MRFKKMNEQEWFKIGNQAQHVRRELFSLMGMSYGSMPKATVAPLKGTLKHLDKFKLQASS